MAGQERRKEGQRGGKKQWRLTRARVGAEKQQNQEVHDVINRLFEVQVQVATRLFSVSLSRFFLECLRLPSHSQGVSHSTKYFSHGRLSKVKNLGNPATNTTTTTITAVIRWHRSVPFACFLPFIYSGM
jgi:hypothetical protein